MKTGFATALLLDRWRTRAVESLAEPEEDRQTLVDRVDFVPRQLAEHASDPPLQRRIKNPLTWSTCNRRHVDQWKALIDDNVGITHDNAGSAALSA